MFFDEPTSALAQPLLGGASSHYELQVSTPSGQFVSLPLLQGLQTLEALPLPDGASWSAEPLDNGIRVVHQNGEALIETAGEVSAERVFRVGESFLVSGLTFWVVDARNAYVGMLEGLNLDYAGRTWNLGYRSYRVGRRNSNRQNEIELNDASVSRAQCTVVTEGSGDVYLVPETSNSVVAVNGSSLGEGDRWKLRNGDLVQLGQLRLRYRQHGQNLFPGDGSLPSQIGVYTVVGKLGAGGMGVVYDALDPQGQPVAIKVPLPHLVQDEDFVRRFNREMMLGASLTHPRLTRIYHFEPAGEGKYPYLVMEKLTDSNLEQLKLPIPVGQALDWTEQILEALECLHAAGVVHRDLKPANLYRTAHGLKVADLGLAHLSDVSADQATKSGDILGTPAYIDVAVLRGHPCTPTSDLYAVGIILYEWVTGSLPYPTDTLQIFRYKLTQDLPPVAEVAPHLPRSLSHFLELLINSEPDMRFRSAQEAREALRELRDTDPDLA